MTTTTRVRYSYMWNGFKTIELFDWLIRNNVHIYSSFVNMRYHVGLPNASPKVYFTGEAWMDDVSADVVIGFMPNDSRGDNFICTDILHKKPAQMCNKQRPDVKYIQLRLQELDYVTYKALSMLPSASTSNDKFCEYIFTIKPYTDLNTRWLQVNQKNKTDLCLFMVSNSGCLIRNMAFDMISKICRVDSGGRYKRNMSPKLVIPSREDRNRYLRFISKYKFMITFENQSLPFYHTEKIWNAFEAGIIPIYWGDPYITEIYNPKCFIHVKTYSDPDEQLAELQRAITKIQSCIANPDEYMQFFAEPCIIPDAVVREEARLYDSLTAISKL